MRLRNKGFLLYLVRNPISLTSKKMCVYLPHFFDFVNPLVAVSLIGENESFIKNPIILHRNERDFI